MHLLVGLALMKTVAPPLDRGFGPQGVSYENPQRRAGGDKMASQSQ